MAKATGTSFEGESDFGRSQIPKQRGLRNCVQCRFIHLRAGSNLRLTRRENVVILLLHLLRDEEAG